MNTKEVRFTCDNCTENEKIVLDFFQDYGIKDKYALATLMGNIKQESRFTPNICEGGHVSITIDVIMVDTD